jgi:hypothetical protein
MWSVVFEDVYLVFIFLSVESNYFSWILKNAPVNNVQSFQIRRVLFGKTMVVSQVFSQPSVQSFRIR